MTKKASIAGAVVAGFPSPAAQYLGASLDLNARYGKDKVFSAAEGIEKPWKMKRGKLSPRATTNWNEPLVVG